MAASLWLVILLLAAGPVSARTFKFATLVPDGTAWMKEVRKAAGEIEKRTDGRVKLKFYPGGVMGNDASMLRKIRIGQLHGGAFTGGSLAGVYPDAQIYSLPFLFRNHGEVDYVREHVDQQILAGLEKAGFVAFGVLEIGFSYLMSNKAMRGVEDFRGQKVWTPVGDTLSASMLKAFGVSAIQLPIADVYTGLQTGLIDTVGNTPVGAIALQWFTRITHVTDLPLLYVASYFVLDAKAFKRLGAGDQVILREILGASNGRLNVLARKDNAGAREAMSAQSIEFVLPDKNQLPNWLDAARRVRVELRDQGVYSEAMLKTILGHLEKYRAAHGQP